MAMYQTTTATIQELGIVRDSVEDSLHDIHDDIDKNTKEIRRIDSRIDMTNETVEDVRVTSYSKIALVKNKQKYFAEEAAKYVKLILGLEIIDCIIDLIQLFIM